MKKSLVYLLVFGLLVSFQTSISAQSSQKLFQTGLILEEAEGDLNKAIEIYYSLVNDVNADRSLRAKALLQVGICYEKLGNQKAGKTYQKLIAEYSDQPEIVAIGKKKLKSIKNSESVAKKSGIVATQVWSPAQDTYGVSPNGRYLNYIDWNNISLNIKDLHTGKTNALTKKGTWKSPVQFPNNSIWSPDSKKLVYSWYVGKDKELHIVNIDGSSDKIIAKGKNGTGPHPVDWTADGKYILAIKSDEIKDNKIHRMVLVSVDDGSEKVLKTLSDCGCYMVISPNNKYILYTLPQKNNSKNNDIYILSIDGSIDKKIVSDPANDTSPVWSPDGEEILFVSDRYGTNDLWKLKVEKGNPVEPAEIVKVDLGSRYRLFHITKDNNIFYNTDNSRIDVYIAKINDNVSSQPVKISELSNKRNINPTWSPNGQYVSFLRWPMYRDNRLGRKFLLTLYDTQTNKSRDIDTEIYGTPNFYRPQWTPDSNGILFNGIVKNSMKGGLFLFDIDTKKKTPIKVKNNMSRTKMDNFNAFYTYSSHGKSMFHLSKDKKSILKYNINSKQETTIVSGTKILLYYKLSNDNSKIAFGYWYPDNKGIYIASTTGGEKKKVFEANSDCECSPNVLLWGKDDKYLYYKEGKFKKIMRVSVNGGEPKEVFDLKGAFPDGKILRVDMHPDGNNILVELEVGKGGETWKLEGIFSD